ncbi:MULTISPECIES: RidA family protein [Aquamicrobium]|uniref:Endoribonuclease n=1 Tax=Aquamicrobium defluvii TaxID=69279 RepID=A0A011U7Y2_9HYPH|nr:MULTISPECIES: RidA family protein [Aquamicrobium]EXL02221.1 endoribonuclease [Aquamicrobium defluvii]EZQ12978.1 endoribonuclease [Halopseudomonas bauzanensis]MCK9550200.1 RidA family protein [Aquamicrobium sp.]
MNDITRIGFDTRIHHVTKHAGLVYLTGQVGTPGLSAEDQTAEVLAKIDSLLEQAGTDKTRILHATLWLDDVRDFAAVNKVWDAWIDKASAPCRSTGQARMAQPGMLVEIIVVAAA